MCIQFFCLGKKLICKTIFQKGVKINSVNILDMAQEQKIYGVYTKSLLTTKLSLSIREVGKNVKQNLERMISKKMEGKCIPEGFIKPGTVKVMTYSSGTINNENVEFHTIFECMICYPVEGMLVECTTKTITKAGIHAEVIDDTGTVPITVFVARDHHFTEKNFGEIKENAKIAVRVAGVRFELNDPYICVIGKLVEQGKRVQIGGDVTLENEFE
jgi:DNA-directed RNA polymerase subunit E'/Rpb7